MGRWYLLECSHDRQGVGGMGRWYLLECSHNREGVGGMGRWYPTGDRHWNAVTIVRVLVGWLVTSLVTGTAMR